MLHDPALELVESFDEVLLMSSPVAGAAVASALSLAAEHVPFIHSFLQLRSILRGINLDGWDNEIAFL